MTMTSYISSPLAAWCVVVLGFVIGSGMVGYGCKLLGDHREIGVAWWFFGMLTGATVSTFGLVGLADIELAQLGLID